MNSVAYRTILHSDNPTLAAIVKGCLQEFGANKPGTVFFDDTTNHLFELFQQTGSTYFVALADGVIMGGAGIFPSNGLPDDTAELVKMYLLKEARGMGIGKQLIYKCLDWAKTYGYARIYLETMPELQKALAVYEHMGFTYLEGPMGNTGHFGCDRWMIKTL